MYKRQPTWLLKECIDDLAPYLSQIFSLSLQSGVVPAAFKTAVICPRIKKAGLDQSDVKSYRPISHLTVMSKLLEKIVASQLVSYLSDNDLLPDSLPIERFTRLKLSLPDCCPIFSLHLALVILRRLHS